MKNRPVIFILGASALPLAQQLRASLNGEIHAPQRTASGDVTYAKAQQHLARLFSDGRPIIGLCASGILIRAIAPHLSDKTSEPPVIAVAEDGSSVVPLLGGHHGANDLARCVAEIAGGHAAITTASEVRLGVALDDPPTGYTLQNPQHVKDFTRRILDGEKVHVMGSAPWLDSLSLSPDATLRIVVTEQAITGDASTLVYHPHCLTIGVGCERGARGAELAENALAALAESNLHRFAVSAIASIDLKEDEPAIAELAELLKVPARFFSVEQLNEVADAVENPSEAVRREVGVASVAEAAALRAFAPLSQLRVKKRKSQRTTCAISIATVASSGGQRQPVPCDPARSGTARGMLHVVGIGPGAMNWRSPAATDALDSCTDWVGYALYLDLVADLKADQVEHRYPLGGEEDRVRHAVALAQQGKQVALVCSGDAGIYAMAALVYEIIDLEPCRIGVSVIPGISAFQAAAAKAGAMIGHDFCCISLSDLLTPWQVIERRVQAAAEGDFVISFYNPRSLKRRDQLERAFAILAQHRPASTPVMIASNLGRPGEKVRIVRFSEFNPEDVDMLTLVMVGSSQSRSFQRGDGRTYAYTPRGYAKKRELPQ